MGKRCPICHCSNPKFSPAWCELCELMRVFKGQAQVYKATGRLVLEEALPEVGVCPQCGRARRFAGAMCDGCAKELERLRKG